MKMKIFACTLLCMFIVIGDSRGEYNNFSEFCFSFYEIILEELFHKIFYLSQKSFLSHLIKVIKIGQHE